jgi:Flp pilus assembly protein TadD
VIRFTLIFLLLLRADDVLLNKADLLIREGQLPAAETAVRDYLNQDPSSAAGHFKLGFVLFLEHKAADSLAAYTEGAKYSVPTAPDLKIVASDYVMLSDFTDADKWFSKLVEWTPKDPQAWYDLGRTKYNENRFEEAITAFHKALQFDPANVKAEDNLGLSLGALGRTDEAIAAYKRAIALQDNDPAKSPNPYLDYGSLLLESDQLEPALPLLNEALRLAPEDYRVHRELGKAYLHSNLPDKARTELEKAIDLEPNNAPLHFMLAQVYRKLGLPDKEKQELARYAALK